MRFSALGTPSRAADPFDTRTAAPEEEREMDVSLTYANQLKGLLAKADGKDKFVALLQYAAMFAAAGEPGAFLAAQKSLSAARKPFRVFKPVEFLMPLVERPPKGKGLGACLAYVRVPPAEARAPARIFAIMASHEKATTRGKPSTRFFTQRSFTVASPKLSSFPSTTRKTRDEKNIIIRMTNLPMYPRSSSLPPLTNNKQVKAVGMALYVGADHVVWATSAGVLSGGDAKKRGERFQKLSLWAWFVASVASAAAQTGDLTQALDEMSAVPKRDSKDTDTDVDTDNEAPRLVAAAKARAHMGAVATSAAQAFLALALLEKTSLSKRHVAALGVAVSVANRHENIIVCACVQKKNTLLCVLCTYTTKKPSANASSLVFFFLGVRLVVHTRRSLAGALR